MTPYDLAKALHAADVAAWPSMIESAFAEVREACASIADAMRDEAMEREALHDVAGYPRAAVSAGIKANKADDIARAIRARGAQ